MSIKGPIISAANTREDSFGRIVGVFLKRIEVLTHCAREQYRVLGQECNAVSQCLDVDGRCWDAVDQDAAGFGENGGEDRKSQSTFTRPGSSEYGGSRTAWNAQRDVL